jgi:hypothetical protein
MSYERMRIHLHVAPADAQPSEPLCSLKVFTPHQDAFDDFRCQRLVEDQGSSEPPSTLAFQQAKYEQLLVLPAADINSQKLETISKSLFQEFGNRALIDKFAGCGLFERALILQTRLLLMLQVLHPPLCLLLLLLLLLLLHHAACVHGACIASRIAHTI